MSKKIQILRNKFSKYNIDGYVIPKNDDYFTEYSKINRLKIVSNFNGSAGIAVILKKKNYLFVDGRYTIQAKIECGKEFIILDYNKIINCKVFKDLRIGFDPKLFTSDQVKKIFSNNRPKPLKKNLVSEIVNFKQKKNKTFLLSR